MSTLGQMVVQLRADQDAGTTSWLTNEIGLEGPLGPRAGQWMADLRADVLARLDYCAQRSIYPWDMDDVADDVLERVCDLEDDQMWDVFHGLKAWRLPDPPHSSGDLTESAQEVLATVVRRIVASILKRAELRLAE
ncbi:hypothetical protein ACFVBP_10425 [Nocardioides sp. NPDC057764]|uniref:hypothetical protein n=1 Tax=Nocardioides sp. NPDC057764 TaxID=3346243 RepID=UPI00366BEAA2